jgi:hypothetical protein
MTHGQHKLRDLGGSSLGRICKQGHRIGHAIRLGQDKEESSKGDKRNQGGKRGKGDEGGEESEEEAMWTADRRSDGR